MSVPPLFITPAVLEKDLVGNNCPVCSSGNYVMVGLPNPGSGLAGNVYVYQLVGSAWTLVQTLPGVFVNDNFGASVAYDDSIGALIIGATGVGSVDPSGRAYYYQRQGSGLFAQVGTYFTGSGVSATALFGTLVSVSGTNVAVSAPTQTGGGAVYYFTIAVSTSVTQRQKLTVGGSLALGTKGLAVYGTHLMVSDYNNATHFNNVYAYELTAGSYGLIQTIAHPTANDKDFGGPIFIGSAGALLSAIANAATPSVYYYTYAAGTWTQAQHLTDGAAASGYGVTTWSVVSSALGNTMLYVGCTDPTQGLYTYYLNGGGTWTLNQNLIPGPASSNVAGTGAFLFAITTGELFSRLFIYSIAYPTITYGQLVFGGVTRRVGKEVSPSYDYRLVPYKTQYVVTVNWLAYTAFVGSTITPAPPHTYYVPINNYDVELYSLQIIDTIGYPYSSAKVQLYNAARVALSNVPVVALYLSDPVPYGRNSSDRPSIGAFVPPLVFPKETNIQLDVYSLLTPANGTQTLTFVFEGMQRIPK